MRKHRGINAIHLPWGMSFPNNLQPTAGADPLTFDEFCAQLAEAGANTVRVKFCGWNDPLSQDAPSFEPRLREYNDWDGRLPELVDACLAHGIKLHAIPFDNQEWLRDDVWAGHAWNTRNNGVITDPRDALQHPEAIAAARDRIDALIERAGIVIGAWEICAEMRWMLNPGFWETTWEDMPRVVREIAAPWVEQMAQHIQANHSAPVGNGHVRDLGGRIEFVNEVHRVPSLDFALINWYGENVASKLRELRAAQAYTGKPIYVEQYAPWTLGKDAPYTREPDNLSWSKANEWAAACGERGLVGPLRWPEI